MLLNIYVYRVYPSSSGITSQPGVENSCRFAGYSPQMIHYCTFTMSKDICLTASHKKRKTSTVKHTLLQ